MKRLIFTLLLIAGFASAGTLNFNGTTGFGYFSVNGEITNQWIGECVVAFTTTNAAYECQGVFVNGNPIKSPSPWKFNVAQVQVLNFSPMMVKLQPQPFPVADGVMGIGITLTSNEWKKVIFASPTQTKESGANIYLYPSSVDSVAVKAASGDVYVNTTTNTTQTVITQGGTAVVPISPIVIKEGETLVIGKPISALYIKGEGEANIIGATR